MFGMGKIPEKPNDMNGEHAALWGFMLHLNSRIDAQYAIQAAIFLAVIGTLVAVILK